MNDALFHHFVEPFLKLSLQFVLTECNEKQAGQFITLDNIRRGLPLGWPSLRGETPCKQY